MAIVFNGRSFAKLLEEKLATRVKEFPTATRVKTVTFIEDEGSMLYTRLKKQAAERIGISYEPVECSIKDDPKQIETLIFKASQDPLVSGVMIQKPAASVFDGVFPSAWWGELVKAIDPEKDVDCLTPENLIRVKDGTGKIYPATVKAVLSILEQSRVVLNITPDIFKRQSVAIVGRSDIVGKPLSWILGNSHDRVELFGRDNLPNDLLQFDIVISAVGKSGLIHGDKLKDGVILIDVGSPKGDIDFESSVTKAAFITPVPGGVGPLTVASLMENIINIKRKSLED